MGRHWLQWGPSSMADLRNAEAKLLSTLRSPHRLVDVNIGPFGLRESEPPEEHRSFWHWQRCRPTDPDCFINTLVVGEHAADYSPRLTVHDAADHTVASRRPEEPCQGAAEAGVGSHDPAPEATGGAPHAESSELPAGGPQAGRSEKPSLEQGSSESLAPGPSSKPSMVLLHGYGASLGFFFRNFDALARHFNVFAVDLLGWGASSRPLFTPTSPQEVDDWFVESLERWRRALQLTSFVLLGHSLGGYVAARYALRYPQPLSRLLLVGPAGFLPESRRMRAFRRTWPGFAMHCLWEANVTPAHLVRTLGPLSQHVLRELLQPHSSEVPPGQEPMRDEELQALADYMSHSVFARASGELCMKFLFSFGAFARRPLLDDVELLAVPTSFIYGEDDFMSYRAGVAAAKKMQGISAEVLRVKHVGHMPFLENPSSFHDAVLHACQVEALSTFKTVQPYVGAGVNSCPGLVKHQILEEQADLSMRRVAARKLAHDWGIG